MKYTKIKLISIMGCLLTCGILSGNTMPSNLPASLDTIPDVRVAPLVKSKWGKNSRCGMHASDLYTPEHAAAGCIAVSMSQVMHYHEYPVTGIGRRQYSITVDGQPRLAFTRGGDGAGGPYRWEWMLEDVCNSPTGDPCEAISALIYDAGLSVGMNYRTNNQSSGSSSAALRSALVRTFYYSSAKRGGMGNLIETINANLDAGYPVILVVGGGAAAHAFVCDGYGYCGSALYYHFNLNRLGKHDAWYNLNKLAVPDFAGTKFNNTIISCVYNIFPSGEGEIISGRAVDELGRGLQDVTVIATGPGGPYQTRTRYKGVYSFAQVMSDSDYTIHAEKWGYTSSSQTVHTGTSLDDSLAKDDDLSEDDDLSNRPSGNRWGIDLTLNSGLSDGEEDFEAGELAQKWTSEGAADWTIEVASSHSGFYVAKSGSIDNNQSCTLSTTAVCRSGQVNFWYRVSSEAQCDNLVFAIDGKEKGRWSGEQDWAQESYPIPEGSHSFAWTYTKDSSESEGDDSAWLDDIVLPLASTEEVIDDFESYSDVNELLSRWRDAREDSTNGAIVGYPDPCFTRSMRFLETKMVNSGEQSLPVFYDTKTGTCEATRILKQASLHDWTKEGVSHLSLWFKGGPPLSHRERSRFVGNTHPFKSWEQTVVMSGSSSGFNKRTDELQYTFQRQAIPCAIEVKIEGITSANGWAQAGLMIRETLDPGSRFNAITVTPEHGCITQGRQGTDHLILDNTTLRPVKQASLHSPCFLRFFLKVEYWNNEQYYVFRPQYSQDGETWRAEPWTTEWIVKHEPMPKDVYIGLVVTSSDPNQSCSATFTIEDSTDDPEWTYRDVGQWRNESTLMYIRITDSEERNAIVYHEDPHATQIETWTPWTIDLKEFAAQGVDLTNITAFFIGFEDAETTSDSGVMYIDDIRLSAIPAQGATPSALEITHEPITEAESDEVLNIGAQVTSDLPISSVKINYRFRGQTVYQSQSLSKMLGDLYGVTLLGSLMHPPGLEYYLEAQDAASTVTHGSQANPHIVQVGVVGMLEIIHELPSDIEIGQPLSICAQITDDQQVQSVTMFYRPIGAMDYQSVPMQRLFGDLNCVTLPGALVTEPGLEYYIEANDGTYIVQHGSPDSPHQIDLAGEEIPSSLIVYDDSLAPGWSDQSSGTTINFHNISPIYDGEYSISCTYHGHMKTLGLEPDSPVLAGDWEAIQFYVRGSAGGESLRFLIYTKDTNKKYVINIEGDVSSSEWRLVRTTLKDLGIPESEGIVSLTFRNPNGTPTLYFDSIMFTKASP